MSLSLLDPAASADDTFVNHPPVKGAPVENDEVLRNILDSKDVDAPLFRKREAREGSMIFVAGGPTLLQYLEEIRERHKQGEYIITSNNTHDYLVDNGIVPDGCLIIDPKERVKDYIKLPQSRTEYFVCVVANKQTFANLLSAGAKVNKLLAAYGMEDQADVDLQYQIYRIPSKHFLVGGTMTPLRAMHFAHLMGFRKCEFYGFDSCFSTEEPPIIQRGERRFAELIEANGGVYYTDTATKVDYVIDEPAEGGFFYAYKKPRAEHVTVAEVGGRRFLTTYAFGNQAKQICKWVDRLDGTVEIVIHGDSLSSHILNVHRANQARAKAEIGDRRWTPEYASQQRMMHDRGYYGEWGDRQAELLARAIVSVYYQVKRPVKVLDYGCGSGTLGEHIERMFRHAKVTNYDPFRPEWEDGDEPGFHDITSCIDVMEHVEYQCVDNVLKYIAERTKFLAVFNIATGEAGKTLPDGRNAHITIRPATWWFNKLNERFVCIEAVHNDGEVSIVCQKREVKDLIEAEQATMKQAA